MKYANTVDNFVKGIVELYFKLAALNNYQYVGNRKVYSEKHKLYANYYHIDSCLINSLEGLAKHEINTPDCIYSRYEFYLSIIQDSLIGYDIESVVALRDNIIEEMNVVYGKTLLEPTKVITEIFDSIIEHKKHLSRR